MPARPSKNLDNIDIILSITITTSKIISQCPSVWNYNLSPAEPWLTLVTRAAGQSIVMAGGQRGRVEGESWMESGDDLGGQQQLRLTPHPDNRGGSGH